MLSKSSMKTNIQAKINQELDGNQIVFYTAGLAIFYTKLVLLAGPLVTNLLWAIVHR